VGKAQSLTREVCLQCRADAAAAEAPTAAARHMLLREADRHRAVARGLEHEIDTALERLGCFLCEKPLPLSAF
jgi:hypothetical protein